VQITRTDPWRRITLHFSHIFFTEGRTFMHPALVLLVVRRRGAGGTGSGYLYR
jgi:hypothetical protein